MAKTPTTTTTLPPQAARPSGDFTSLASRFGGGGPVQQYTQEQQVYLGRTPFEGTADHPRSPADRIVPISRANGLIYTWGLDELRAFQTHIVQAGIVQQRDISFGARDATTVRVWQLLVGQSADAYDGGAKVSPTDLLGELVGSPLPGPAGPDRGPGRVPSNPDDIEAFAEQVAKGELGQGNLSAEDVAKIVNDWHAWEAPYLGHAEATPPGQGAQQAFVEERVREIDPLKVDARKLAGAAQVFQQMLSGGQVTNG